MDILMILVVFLAVIVCGLLLWIVQQRRTAVHTTAATLMPYVRIERLLSDVERSFYRLLHAAIGRQYTIFTKVSVSGLLKSGRSVRLYQGGIERRHVDFVLCAPNDLAVVCAIVLDDGSGSRQEQGGEHAASLDAAFASAGLPLVRFKSRVGCSERELLAHLQHFIEVEMPEEEESIAAPLSVPTSVPASPAKRRLPVSQRCPKCGSRMLRKKVANGYHSGDKLWCCSNFPTCHTVIPLA